MAENGKHERLAAEIAGGSSVREAAATIGMAERTAYRATESADFRRRVAEIRTKITDRAIGLLSDAATEAVQTLASLLQEENKPADRIAAAKAILSAVKPLSELGELRDRLDAIELAQAEAEARAAA